MTQGHDDAGEPVDEDAIDLSGLDQPGGFERELAKMTGASPDEVAEAERVNDALAEVDDEDFDDLEKVRELRKGKASRLFGSRSPIVSTLVIGIGGYLLATMASDVRYFLAEREVTDLGAVSDIYADGSFDGSFHNRQVQLSGTPDVQHAAKLTEADEEFGVVRLREGGGSLFAMLPAEDERRYDQFSGEFTGRMRQMNKAPYYNKIRQFFDGEGIVNSYDVDPETFGSMVDSAKIVFSVPGAGEMTAGEGDSVVLSFRQPEFNVQLGRKTWPSDANALAAIQGLGYPYIALDDKTKDGPGAQLTRTFRRFVVHPPDGISEQDVLDLLHSGHEVPADNPDPKVGAAVFPSTHTYVVDPGDLSRAGDDIVFVYGTNTTAPGYVVDDGALVERGLDNDSLAMPLADLTSVRVDHPVTVDPEGYLIEVGGSYRDERLTALLFLLVVALMATNVVSLVLRWKKRQAAA